MIIANVVWPALYAEDKVSSMPIIALSLVIEYFFFRRLFNLNAKQAFFYTFAANLASGLVGLVGRPLSGLLYELTIGMLVSWIFEWGTFNPVAWISVPIFGGALNALLELLTIRIIWKHKLSKENFCWLWLANIITVGIATTWVIASPREI
ncbi:MAG: hypothetical protein QE267_05535 [Akkermansiaceae bacterium]|nr:hypothetical protein [Akkermansiaceae bacterium]